MICIKQVKVRDIGSKKKLPCVEKTINCDIPCQIRIEWVRFHCHDKCCLTTYFFYLGTNAFFLRNLVTCCIKINFFYASGQIKWLSSTCKKKKKTKLNNSEIWDVRIEYKKMNDAYKIYIRSFLYLERKFICKWLKKKSHKFLSALVSRYSKCNEAYVGVCVFEDPLSIINYSLPKPLHVMIIKEKLVLIEWECLIFVLVYIIFF